MADSGLGEKSEISAPAPVRHDPYPGILNWVKYLAYDGLWLLVATVLSPWWVVRCLFNRDFRHMVAERLTLGLPRLNRPDPAKPRVMVHGVSVGEVLASRSLVNHLLQGFDVVVSASTNTGMEVARREFPELAVVRYPLDPSILVRRFFRRVDPQHVILMELEVWPNFLKWSNRRGAPIAIVNGRITERSLHNYLRFHRRLPQFLRVTLFAAQDQSYADRFVQLLGSDERVVVTGNIKADGLEIGPVPETKASRELQDWVDPGGDRLVLLAGSTHGDEDLLLFQAFREACPGSRIVLVPRHPGRGLDVVEQLAAVGARAQLLTRLRAGDENLDLEQPLIVDTVGELGSIYGLATLVFVGGSLVPHGGHNVLEPAARGKAVLYGPHTHNFFQETALLEQVGGAIRVRDTGDLMVHLSRLAQEPGAREAMAKAAMGVVMDQRGATARTLASLERYLGLKTL